MLKKLLAGAAALVALGTASAAPTYYNFEWKGFDVFYTNPWTGETDGGWSPLATIKGDFKGEDLNGDDIITLDEISRLGIDAGGGRSELIGCPGTAWNTGGLTNCSISAFSYVKGGDLTLRVGGEWTSSGSIYSYKSWSMPGGGYSSSSNDVCCGNSWANATPETTFTMTAAVPEPSTWAMLGAGLLMTAGAVRRRQRGR